MTSPEIDPRTVRLAAQRLIRYATPGPILHKYVHVYHSFVRACPQYLRVLRFFLPQKSSSYVQAKFLEYNVRVTK